MSKTPRPIDPSIQAKLDQVRAWLRDMVTDTRQHWASDCDFPDTCPGEKVLVVSDTVTGDEARALLKCALTELARTDFAR